MCVSAIDDGVTFVLRVVICFVYVDMTQKGARIFLVMVFSLALVVMCSPVIFTLL